VTLTLADAVSEVVITGQRAAERRALQTKKVANNFVEALYANDVGKLPDQNVAEAVHRLPGVTVANDQGEGRYVIIRGVDPRYANVTVNGQTAAAPEPDNRQVKLDDIPSSLIGSK
jgi:TonB-dependent receptor